MLKESLKYPSKGGKIVRTLIGGLFTATSIIIIPLLTLIGYSLNVIERTVNGEDTPPAFVDYIKTTKEGIYASGIMVMYGVLPLVILVILMGLLTVIATNTGQVDRVMFTITVGIVFLLFFPIILASYYILPAALATYAVERDLRKAFNFNHIKNIVWTETFIIKSLYPLIVGLGASLVMVVLASSVIGFFITPFIQFYIQLTLLRMVGVIYKKAEKEDTSNLKALLNKFSLFDLNKLSVR